MANLTIEMLARIARQELGADPSGEAMTVRDYANEAGRALMGGRPWQWAEGREVRLRPRAAITLTAATWTEATLRLTETGAFEDYVWHLGDVVRITDGTGATTGTYEVSERVDDDTIELATSIGSAANGQTDIEGRLPNSQITLPSDFGLLQITGFAMSDGLIGLAEMTSTETMLRLRSLGTLGSAADFWGLLRHVRSTAGGRPIPRLELHPESDDEDEVLVLVYRGGWLEPSTDQEILSIPDWLDSAYIELFKAVLYGHEEPENGRVSERIRAVREDIVWADAVRIDAEMQQSLGAYENCWLDDTAVSQQSRYSAPVREILPP